MKRREFSQAATVAAVATSIGLAVPALAQQKAPVAGTDYEVLDPRVGVEAPAGKVEVVEFFWYSCPHCFAFEPLLSAWIAKLPKHVAFRRSHVAFRADFVPQQRLYFTLEAMGLLEKLHAKVFNAIHVEKLKLATGEEIADWVARQGFDKAKFVETYNSFSVATKAGRGSQLQNAYKVEGVPALGVAGRYYTDGSKTGSMETALKVVEALVEQSRKNG